MIKDLKNNLILKDFYKKPNFIDNKFILKSKKYLLENDLDSFFRLVKVNLEDKNIYSNRLFYLYFYFLYLLEKEGKTSSFLKNFVYLKLNYKMHFLFENIIDKDIYSFLKKNNKLFKEIKGNKYLFVTIDNDFIKLKEINYRFNDFNEKNIKKDIKELISLLKKLIKSKKITKKIANSLLELTYWDILDSFSFYKNKDKINLDQFIKKKDFKI
jgi:hypothetical protein